MARKIKIILVAAIVFICLPVAGKVFALSATLGQEINFFVDQNYDLSQREKIEAVLQKIGNNTYFYADKQWLNSLTPENKSKFQDSLTTLDSEFYNKIYPTLTATFGWERRPGIDNDSRITILIHPIQKDAGGYFSTKDEYSRLEASNSNEREMVYLNSEYISAPLAKVFLAHEFTHLISFNQKVKIRGIEEDIWLEEARAEYAPTLCGYDVVYEGSNLQRRAQKFLENPSDSLTEWQNIDTDYAVTNIFIQYLIDHYGVKIITDSLQSSKKGIDSLDYALKKNNFTQDFSQVFTDWTIAVLLNDCNLGPKYCYLNPNLKNLRVFPRINVLPQNSNGTLTISDATKNWTGNWYKIIGGKGTLDFKFNGSSSAFFKFPYATRHKNGNYNFNSLNLSSSQQAEIYINNFGEEAVSLFLIPSVQNKSETAGTEHFYPFNWSVSIAIGQQQESEVIKALLTKIQELQNQIISIRAQIDAILAKKGQGTNCGKFENNLYFGLSNNNEVSCLQEFLKNQGTNIYPEAMITGIFGYLTQAAVIRFQEKYASEILAPFNLTKGTGFIGLATRNKINQILGY
jgi:peptidoglycan hydrolase-like protein with peptidoglycan-binding domain